MVTGVSSTGNLEMVESIGAGTVIDYTRQDFTRSGQRYDLLIDIAGSRPFAAYRRVLTSQATVVGIGGPNKGHARGKVMITM
jgi:NADPH:quinone reductase-like Zn-dependent oxidoreductase